MCFENVNICCWWWGSETEWIALSRSCVCSASTRTSTRNDGELNNSEFKDPSESRGGRNHVDVEHNYRLGSRGSLITLGPKFNIICASMRSRLKALSLIKILTEPANWIESILISFRPRRTIRDSLEMEARRCKNVMQHIFFYLFSV